MCPSSPATAGGDPAGTGPGVAVKATLVIEALAATSGCEALKAYMADHCDVLLELLEARGE